MLSALKKMIDSWILGSGEGYFSIAASQAVGKNGIVYAFDADEDLITKLRKELAEKKLTNTDQLL